MVVCTEHLKFDRPMATQFVLGLFALVLLSRGNEATTNTLEAKDMYIGVPGRNLTIIWTYTGSKMYASASIYIPDNSVLKLPGSISYKKLWHIEYIPSKNSIAKTKLTIVNSTFNNLTELDVGRGPIISLNIKAVPRNLSKFEFYCRLKTSNDQWPSELEKVITVRVAVLPTVKMTLETRGGTDVPEGRDVTLRCKAKGFPLPSIEIRKDNVKLPVEQTFEKEVSLRLKSVTAKSAGKYVCFGTNMAGTTRSETVLSVTYIQAKKVKSATVIQSALSRDEDLNCPIEGYPPPTYRWYYPQCNMNSPIGWSKEITIQLDKEAKFGNYCCIGQNNMGLKQATFTIKGPAVQPKKRSGINSGNSLTAGKAMLMIAAFVFLFFFRR